MPVEKMSMAVEGTVEKMSKPTVLAVVVAHNPGAWFDETLASLAYQDYERLGVVVVNMVGDAVGVSDVVAADAAGVVKAGVPAAADVVAADTADTADTGDTGGVVAADTADVVDDANGDDMAAKAGGVVTAGGVAAGGDAVNMDVSLQNRVRSVLPDAFIINVSYASGFASAANVVLAAHFRDVLDKYTYLLVCHDGVAFAVDAVSALVSRTISVEAGVAGPKLVNWERPDVIQHVGYEVDRFATPADIAGAGELDQEQHDSVRDVFACSPAAMLIERELFSRIQGFDPALTLDAVSVDLCWRAQMAGATVVIVGEAQARHRDLLDTRLPNYPQERELAPNRHSLRVMLVNHGRISLAIFVTLAACVSAGDLFLSLVTGRLKRLRAVADAWAWNIVRVGNVFARRRGNTRVRQVRQADVAATQYLGSVKLTAFFQSCFSGVAGAGGAVVTSGGSAGALMGRGSSSVGVRTGRGNAGGNAGHASAGVGGSSTAGAGRGASAGGGFLSHVGRVFIGSFNTDKLRAHWFIWASTMFVLIVGSRSLITGQVPAVGDFVFFPDSAMSMLETWWSGWSERGTGAPTSNLGALFWMAALGRCLELVGSGMGMVRTLWVLAPVVIGLIGAYRMMSGIGSNWAKTGSLAGYMLVGLPFSSLASGSISGLVGYAAAPWMLKPMLRILSAKGSGGFALSGGFAGSGSLAGSGNLVVSREIVLLGLAVGLAALFVPSAAVLVVVLSLGLVVGGLLVGGVGLPTAIVRMIASVVGALVVAAFVVAPFTVDVLAAGFSSAVPSSGFSSGMSSAVPLSGLPSGFSYSNVWNRFLALIADGHDGSAGDVSLVELILFTVNSEGYSEGYNVSRWFLLVPMMLPLLVGRNWRLQQAARVWMLAVVAWGVAFMSQQGILGVGLPDVHLMLAPAAAAAAFLWGLAVITFEHDLRFSHFGWRQAMVPIAALALILQTAGFIPLLDDGRWGLAHSSHHESVQLEPEISSGGYRVIWVGRPEFLPVEGHSLKLDASTSVAGGAAGTTTPGAAGKTAMAWGVTSGDKVTIVDRAVTADPGRVDLLESVIASAVSGRTSRVGRQLAGFGVRYLILVHRLAPAPFSAELPSRSVPEYLVDALSGQLDLEQVSGVNSALTVFMNTSWVPMRARYSQADYPDGFDAHVSDIFDLNSHPLPPGMSVLSAEGPPWSDLIPASSPSVNVNSQNADNTRNADNPQNAGSAGSDTNLGSVINPQHNTNAGVNSEIAGVNSEIFVAQTPSPGWELTIEGERAPYRQSLSWARAYQVAQDGTMVLRYSSPWWRQASQVAGVVFTLFLFVVLWRLYARSRDSHLHVDDSHIDDSHLNAAQI